MAVEELQAGEGPHDVWILSPRFAEGEEHASRLLEAWQKMGPDPDRGLAAAWVTWPRQAWRFHPETKDEREREWLDMCRRIPLLVLANLRNVRDVMLERAVRLVGARLEAGLSTVVISDLRPEDLRSRFPELAAAFGGFRLVEVSTKGA